jgi:hypothetical protein
MEQDSARGASAFLLIPPINAQRAMGPGTAEWQVGLCPRVLCAARYKYRYGTLSISFPPVPYTSVVGLDLSR